jgi:hypothetical protein
MKRKTKNKKKLPRVGTFAPSGLTDRDMEALSGVFGIFGTIIQIGKAISKPPDQVVPPTVDVDAEILSSKIKGQ